MKEGDGGLVDEVTDFILMLYTMSLVLTHSLFCLPLKLYFHKTKKQ